MQITEWWEMVKSTTRFQQLIFVEKDFWCVHIRNGRQYTMKIYVYIHIQCRCSGCQKRYKMRTVLPSFSLVQLSNKRHPSDSQGSSRRWQNIQGKLLRFPAGYMRTSCRPWFLCIAWVSLTLLHHTGWHDSKMTLWFKNTEWTVWQIELCNLKTHSRLWRLIKSVWWICAA